MAEFYSTRGISYSIDEIIQNGKSFIYLLTPYLKFSDTLYERLKGLNAKNVELIIVYGKTELNPFQNKLLRELNCSVYFKENLHAKCYANETKALVCSMNLHSFSEVNNIEMGIKIDSRQDRSAYDKCIDEIRQAIKNAIPIRELKVEKERNFSEDEFTIGWHTVLQETFLETEFKISENNIEAVDFPLPGIRFSTSYGFCSFELPWEQSYLRKLKDENSEELNSFSREYRWYWSSPFNKISLYKRQDSEFENIRKETNYCLAGTKRLIEIIKKIAPLIK